MTTAIDIDHLVIKHGKHEHPEAGACVMEVVSMLAGEPWSDNPQCVDPVIAAFARRLNDAFGDDDEGRSAAFRPIVRKLMGTRGSQALMRRRMFAAADAAVRVFAPLALDARKQPKLAQQLRDVPEITNKATAIRARDIVREVRAAAHAAHAAADAYADAYADADRLAAHRAARREVLAHGITVLEKLCAMKGGKAA